MVNNKFDNKKKKKKIDLIFEIHADYRTCIYVCDKLINSIDIVTKNITRFKLSKTIT